MRRLFIAGTFLVLMIAGGLVIAACAKPSHESNKSESIDPANTYILAIGSCPPWSPLPERICRDDVRLFVDTAMRTIGIPPANVKEVVNAGASFSAVVKGFSWLKRTASPDSAIIVYYNGHGLRVPDSESGKDEEVFILWSEEYPFAGVYAVTAKIWMTDKEFAKLVLSVPGRAKVIVADTCYAARAERHITGRGKKVDYGLKYAALLSAAEESQLAFVVRGYGLFTNNLTQAMHESPNLKEAFFKSRQKTVEESREICLDHDECVEQAPTIEDLHDVVHLFKLRKSENGATIQRPDEH